MRDIKITKKYFWKAAYLAFDNEQDREDYVQECWLNLEEVGNKADVRIIAKQAKRNFYQKYYGCLKAKNIVRTKEHTPKTINKICQIPFADLLDIGIPNNPNDAIAIKPYKIKVNGIKLIYDKFDLSELLKIKPESIRTMKNSGKTFTVWVYKNKIYQNVTEIQKQNKIRYKKAKHLSKQYILEVS